MFIQILFFITTKQAAQRSRRETQQLFKVRTESQVSFCNTCRKMQFGSFAENKIRTFVPVHKSWTIVPLDLMQQRFMVSTLLYLSVKGFKSWGLGLLSINSLLFMSRSFMMAYLRFLLLKPKNLTAQVKWARQPWTQSPSTYFQLS